MAADIRFTDFMIGVLDALATEPGRPMKMDEIAQIMSENPEIPPTNLLRVTPSQLIGPMNRLRNMKWVTRSKTNVGEKQVGNAYYPEIVRTYQIQPSKLALWIEVRKVVSGSRGAISPDYMQELVEDVADARADASLASALGEKPITDNQKVAVLQVIHKGAMDKEERMQLAENHVKPPEDESWKEHKEAFFKWHTIMDREVRGQKPYMTRIIIGRLRFHVFHRGDLDADPHDHPWDFWTFPLRSYVEEVAIPVGGYLSGDRAGESNFELRRFVVKAFRWHFRPAEHRHRVLGRYAGYVQTPPLDGLPNGLFATASADEANQRMSNGTAEAVVAEGRIFTIVWRGKMRRTWGFWKSRVGHWCWQKFDKYIWEGGKNQPCGD